MSATLPPVTITLTPASTISLICCKNKETKYSDKSQRTFERRKIHLDDNKTVILMDMNE